MCLKHAQPVSDTHEKEVGGASEAVPMSEQKAEE